MKADLTREQMMLIVERARYQRSLAAGDLCAATTRQTLRWLARSIDKFLHLLDVTHGTPLKRLTVVRLHRPGATNPARSQPSPPPLTGGAAG